VDVSIHCSDAESTVLGAHLPNLKTFSNLLSHREGMDLDSIGTNKDGSLVINHIHPLPLSVTPADPAPQPMDAIHCTEPPEIMSIILQYTHSQIPQDLRGLPLATITAFGAAVHKYGVYYAVRDCQLLME
jgi:hypothetical protein